MIDQARMTFVIPTFNRPRMLEEAVASCLEQTVPVEIVVVDHGSSAETRRVCERFPSTVTVVRREKDSGPIFAWLDGVLHAPTEFVNLNFDDDLKNPRFAEECMKIMRESVGMVFTHARIIDAFGAPTSSVLFRDWFSTSGVYPSRDFSPFFGKTLVSPCAAVYRRQHMIDALYVGRLPNQRSGYHGVGPDLHLQLLAQLNYPSIGYVAEELTYFRAHAGSITIAASDSGRTLEFDRAYDETRLAIIDLQISRIMRRLRLQQAVFSTCCLVARQKQRLRKILKRYVDTWEYVLTRLATWREKAL